MHFLQLPAKHVYITPKRIWDHSTVTYFATDTKIKSICSKPPPSGCHSLPLQTQPFAKYLKHPRANDRLQDTVYLERSSIPISIEYNTPQERS